MTDRIPISSIQNVFFDAENLDDADLTTEQDYNNQIQSAIVNNFSGSGVLADSLVQRVLFNSDLANGLLDGKAINTQSQPFDTNNGNQLEVELLGSKVAGTRTVKVFIIGLDFQNNLQYDRFTFNRNEKQLSSRHYRAILTIFFNDLVGSVAQSFNLGGRVIIREAAPFSLSRDCIMIAQDIEPNLFFRDFFVTSGGTLANALATALPSYNIDNLNIKTGYKQLRSLNENDVSSQIGQKFLASTNNIQKISLLMSVINNTTPSNLVWTGDLIVSLYQLQTALTCPTDVVPQLQIDFTPSNIPLAQLSINYNSLLSSGTQLNTVPQPVDFIFSNTSVGSGLLVKPGSYYAITAKRAGSADTCKIQFAVGSNAEDNTRETLFSGSVWVDVPEEALWFQVWDDAAKVSDGQAYDAGHGMVIPKNIFDENVAASVDYVLDQIQFVRNDLYYALAQAITQESVPVQDERTGNDILSRKQYVPSISLLNSAALSNIQSVSDPLIIGTITDQNIKFLSSTPLTASFHEYGFVNNEIVVKIIDDASDGYRYDLNIIELVSELVNGNLNGAKLTPNTSNPSIFYRIAKAELITMIYGDVNGDGIIDASDIAAAQSLIGSDLNSLPSYSDYLSSSTLFIDDSALAWSVYDTVLAATVLSGSGGILSVNPIDGTLANFNIPSGDFTTITDLDRMLFIVSGSINTGNNGTFAIVGLVDATDITIKKRYNTSDVMLSIMRADINGDMNVDLTDVGLITDYVNVAPPFPYTSSPANRIGTSFRAMKFTVEKYVDRYDDYPFSASPRNSLLHTRQDVYLDGYSSFASQNLKTTPLPFSITKQLVWNDASVVVNSNPRMMPAAFISQSGFNINSCDIEGIVSKTFPQIPGFDPGRNDIFMPNNIVMNYGSELTTPDGYFYKVDFESSTIAFEIPDINFDTEKLVNIFTDFVADTTGTGYTRIGYEAMRFADCSFVGVDALIKNQVRFSVAVQSFSPLINGLDPSCLSGLIVDGRIGVSIDYSSGILTLNFTNLYQDPIKQTLNTKIQITVFLKKAGWNNKPIFVDKIKAQNLLGITTPSPLPPC